MVVRVNTNYNPVGKIVKKQPEGVRFC